MIEINLGSTEIDSALIVATKAGNKEALQLLLQHGANPNYLNNDGTSILMLAVKVGNKEVVRLLSEHGAFGYLRR